MSSKQKNKGGNKQRKGKKVRIPNKNEDIPVPEVDDDSHVGIVLNPLGDCRFNVQQLTKTAAAKTYICHLSKGKQKGGYIVAGTYVLFSIREFEDKGDIIYTYNDDEVSHLKKTGEIVEINSDSIGKNGVSVSIADTNVGFEFIKGGDVTIDDTNNNEEVDLSII